MAITSTTASWSSQCVRDEPPVSETMPTMRRPKARTEMPRKGSLQRFTKRGAPFLTSIANENGATIVRASDQNIDTMGIGTNWPIVSLKTSGIVSGARREVVAVTTRAREVTPPMKSAMRAMVIPVGTDPKMRSARAQSSSQGMLKRCPNAAAGM